MGYRIEATEQFGDALTRILREEIDSLASDLRARPPRIHEARKHLKKARALLRLIPDSEFHRTARSSFREAARELSGVRDAEAILEALGRLKSVPEPVRSRARRLAETAASEHRHADAAQAAARILPMLARTAAEFSDQRFAGDRFSLVAEPFRRAYRKARRAYARASARQTASNLHELRKSTKDHWYHVLLLESAWPEVLHPYSRSLKRVAEALGSDRDLTLLRQVLVRATGTAPIPSIAAAIRREQSRLRREGLDAARKIFAEKPGSLARRFAVYWEAPGPASGR